MCKHLLLEILLERISSEAVLPIEVDFLPEYLNIHADPNIDAFIYKMNEMKKKLYGKVDENIQEAQERQKNDYDKKRKQSTVSLF